MQGDWRRQKKVEIRTLYKPKPKGAAPTFCRHAKAVPPAEFPSLPLYRSATTCPCFSPIVIPPSRLYGRDTSCPRFSFLCSGRSSDRFLGYSCFPSLPSRSRRGISPPSWPRSPSQFGKELLPAKSLPHPRCFCEACQNKGVAGASVRKRVKTRDLETDYSALQNLCFDMDAHCWCKG